MAEGLDGEGIRDFYGRLDFNGLTVTGSFEHRQKDVPTASYGTLFNQHDPRQQTQASRSLVDAQYGRLFGATRVTRAVRGRQTVTAGVEFIDNLHQDQTSGFDASPVLALDDRRSSTQHAIYVQDEIKPARWLVINAGLRYDGYDTFLRVTPRGALIILPSSTQSVKYLYGRAFLAPNGYELNTLFFGEAGTRLRPESIDTHELVWERYINDWLRTSASTYWYTAQRLTTGIPDASTLAGVSFVNEGEVRAKGLELEAQMRLKGESRGLINYAFQHALNQETRAVLPNSPHHVVQARVSVPGPTPRSFVSVEAQHLSSRETLVGSKVSAAGTVNVNLIQAGRSWEITVNGQNLFDVKYADPASSQQRQEVIPQNGRTARIGLRRNMWAH